MNRAAVKRRIADLAALFYEDEPVTVTYALDTEPDQDITFELGPADGDVTEDSVDGLYQTDRFTVLFRIEAHGFTNAADAEEEAERVYNLFVDGLMSRRNLMHPDLPWTPPATGTIQTTVVGSVEGPRSSFPNGGFDMSWVQGSINVTTALEFEET